MSIWKHSDAANADYWDSDIHAPHICRFCRTHMRMAELADQWPQPDAAYLELHNKEMFDGGDVSFVNMNDLQNEPNTWLVESGSPSEMYVTASVCPACGWWSVGKQVALNSTSQVWDLFFRTDGALRSLKIHDINLPLEDIRAYLMVKYLTRFNVHPKKFEEVVGSIFANLGYDSIVTAYSRDAGIDVVLFGPGGERVGVQVKRYKNSITVEQIRSFVGALCLGGFVRGIFVTTSRFQSGAATLVQQAAETCMPIDLVDEKAFFEALGVAQIIGTDPIPDVLNMLASDARPQLSYVTEFHRNSL